MRLSILGFPLSHSLSPAMHNAALREVGLSDWRYEAMPIEPARLSEAVQLIRGDDYAGANVTVPHKEKIMPLLDGVTPVAEAIGAVNTIVKRDGKLIGHNTDAAGLLADLHTHGVKIQDRVVLVLGAGGSARAAVAACAGMGAKIKFIARRRDQAESLASDFQLPTSNVFDLTINDLTRASHDCALILNCTPLGMSPNIDSSPWFDSVPFPKEAFVYDLVYNPRETKLVKQARAQGLSAATGLGMLIEQGALGFELWTGKDAPRKVMREAAEEKMKGK
ncbi:MAG: shikimate dehydrogenase [Chloroflexota bacterium]